MESLKYIFTNLSIVFRSYVKLSKSQISCSVANHGSAANGQLQYGTIVTCCNLVTLYKCCTDLQPKINVNAMGVWLPGSNLM